MTSVDLIRASARRATARDALEPWRLAGVLDHADIETAATLTAASGDSSFEVQLAVALAVRAPRHGHVAVDPETIAASVASEREHDTGTTTVESSDLDWPADPEAWVRSVASSRLAADGLIVVDDSLIYLGRFHRAEVRCASQLRRRVEASVAAPITERFDRLADALTLSEEQRRAVTTALTGTVTVLIGGPGTGKTTTVAALLAALVDTYGPALRIALAAPTGKAAARMGESLASAAQRLRTSEIAGIEELADVIAAAEPSTLHRLLGRRPDDDVGTHHAANPLPHDVIIVDETSMVSLPLMDSLLDAARSDARIVLVGDPDQLASVDAGSVLGDLVAAGGHETSRGPLSGRVVRLVTSHRFPQGSPIDRFATAVRIGDAEAAIRVLEEKHPDADGVTLDFMADVAPAEALLADHARHLAELAAAGRIDDALDVVETTKVLCAHRRGRAGVSWWNSRAERALADHGVRLSRFYPGRPILVTANDPMRHLFNGDLGVAVATGATVAVAFPESSGFRVVAPAHLGSVETVHAMTIHKSQGSEFDHVMVILPPIGSRLATRELLYTAVTRARRRVSIVGDPAAVRAAVTTRVRRASGLTRRLLT
jgi:exodeoxyribonuclease V alpha subunit